MLNSQPPIASSVLFAPSPTEVDAYHVRVNGCHRGKIYVPKGSDEATIRSTVAADHRVIAAMSPGSVAKTFQIVDNNISISASKP